MTSEIEKDTQAAKDVRLTKVEGDAAMEVTARDGPFEEDEGEGAKDLVQMPCRVCQTPTFSSAAARRCFPELS